MTATAFRIAVREARAARGKFLFVIVAVALGVGSLTGVRGFSQAFASMLLREARSIMAADVSVRIFGEPSAEQEARSQVCRSGKVEPTRVTETVSMVSSSASPDPLLVTLKAVDPAVFPFYGDLVLSPAGKLKEGLTPESVVTVRRRAHPAQGGARRFRQDRRP